MIIVTLLIASTFIAPDPGEPPPIPTPTPVAAPVATVVPAELCNSVDVVGPVDEALTGVTQAGIDLLTEAMGCVPFTIGEGIGVLFHGNDISPRLLSVAALHPDGRREVWINPVCWPLVGDWPESIAHELGHMLGWRDMDGHPYMAWPPPKGARVGPNGIIEC